MSRLSRVKVLRNGDLTCPSAIGLVGLAVLAAFGLAACPLKHPVPVEPDYPPLASSGTTPPADGGR